MTLATTLLSLPLTGRYIVDTASSTYKIDVDAGMFVRTPMADDANNLQHDDAPVEFTDITCRVGAPMTIVWARGAKLRTTTPVIGITPLDTHPAGEL